MKIAKATITALLYTSKTLANGEHPVMIRVCYNSKRKYKSTGLSCPAKLWNAAKQEVRGRHPLSVNMNAVIDAELIRLKNKVLDFERQDMAYSAQSLIEASARKPPVPKTLDDLFEERIAYFRDTLQKHNTSTGYRTLQHIVGRFSRQRVVELSDVDKAWLRDFEEYLHARYADTSIKRFFSAFKALMNYAVESGRLGANPFDGFRFGRRLDVRTAKRALDPGELEAVVRYYLDTYYYKIRKKPASEPMGRRYWRSRLRGQDGRAEPAVFDAEQFSLSMFICSYIFQGLALVDLARLKWKDLVCIDITDKEKYDADRMAQGVRYAETHKETATFYEINLVRAKTQHPARVLVEQSVAWPYMEPFAPSGTLSGNDFVFPIYFDEDPAHQFERITYANNVINRCLQRVAERIGLTRKVTFYAARHTYASRLYHADVPLPLIAQNMGRNPAQIETYLKEFDTDRIIDANKRTWQIPRLGHPGAITGAGM